MVVTPARAASRRLARIDSGRAIQLVLGDGETAFDHVEDLTIEVYHPIHPLAGKTNCGFAAHREELLLNPHERAHQFLAAAQAYGAPAFEQGLKHVIRRSLEFDQVANHEIEKVIKAKEPLLHLYEASAPDGASLESEFEKAMQRATTDDDTHPSPSDRFRLISTVRTPAVDDLPGEVWDLFADREAVKRDMLARVEAQIAKYRK